jgi:hypothetical protein
VSGCQVDIINMFVKRKATRNGERLSSGGKEGKEER